MAELCKKPVLRVFKELMENMNEKHDEIIVAGDFNINWKENSVHKRQIESSILDNGCKQIVKEYTRVTKNSSTLIDLVVTSMKNVDAKVVKDLNISDHETLEILINEKERIKKQDKLAEFFKYDKEIFETALEKINLQNIIKDTCLHNATNEFDEKINQVIKNSTFKKRIHRTTDNTWYTEELWRMNKHKIKLYMKAKLSNDESTWEKYRSIRNIYKSKIKKAKRKSIENRIDKAGSQKEMWKAIKETVLCKDKEEIKEVNFDGVKINSSQYLAEKFNKFFVDSIRDIHHTIPYRKYENCIEERQCVFSFERVTDKDLKSICKAINQKKDFTGMSATIILENWKAIGPAIGHIINKSLDEGRFPQSWKESLIVPVPKVKRTRKSEEFRPINMLHVFEKILEKAVQSQLEKYLETNNILIMEQSGFRRNHSCETTINFVINYWKEEIDQKKSVAAVFLDLKRAFETVDRDILIEKLSKYGVKGRELNWFIEYLSKRKQRTKVNEAVSTRIETELGVPQGSVLGTLLFLLYINDLKTVIKHSKLMLFADDTLIFGTGYNLVEIKRELEADLENVKKWLDSNKLKLNIEKSKGMLLNSKSSISIMMSNESIEIVNKIKYLGIVMDNKLNFNEHVDYLCKKIGKKIGYFKRLRKSVSLASAIKIYNVMIKPHFEYCSTVLFLCTQTSKERLQTLQNKAMRIILECNRYTSINWMLSTLKWMNVKQRIKLNVLKFIFKIKNGKLPHYLGARMIILMDAQPYHLRNADVNVRLINCNRTATQNSLIYKGFQLYNNLPVEIKKENNLREYVKRCTEYIRAMS